MCDRADAAGRMVVWAPVIAGSIGLCLLAARRASSEVRAALMGAAASIAFAASAVFTKAFVHYLGRGIFAWAPHWETYALVVIIIFGFVVMQSAFQVGNLAAAVGGLEAKQPVASAIVGVGLLDEHVATASAAELLAVVVATVAILTGIVVLAHEGARTREEPRASAAPATEISLDETISLEEPVDLQEAVDLEEVARSQHTPGDPAAPRRFR